MHSWTSPLLCLLVLLSLSQGQDEQPSDSLRTAIEAVSRRQRDLATAGSNYYSGGLSQYRYPERDSATPEELAFLATPRDFTGDGQPENIGYGYQKTIASPTGIFPPQAPLENDVEPPHPSNSKVLEKILLEYLEDEMKEGEDEGDDDEYLHRGSNGKRSAFRERAGEERGKLEAIKKRGRFGPTAFRERAHERLVDDVEERKRKLFTEALVRKMEEEEDDERRERERGRLGDEDENEEDYLDVLRSVWEKYRRDNPNVIDIEDISEGDVSEILNYLGESGLLDDEDMEGIKEEAEKRQQGGGDYDFLMHNAAMGGWGGGGGHQFRKRWNQRLDGDENQKGSFLYSLKFVSPAVNREAIESLKDDDGLDLPDERDEDILRLSPDINRREPDPWFPAFERGEAPEELFGNPSEEEYQRLILAQQSDHRAGPSRKRLTSLIRPHYSAREISPIPEVFLTPEKKYLYDTAIMKKRYPVTKRSSNFYTSPPLLHHKNFAFTDSEPRKKKDAIGTNVATTDPKVARELNQIFSSPTASDHTHSEPNSKQPAHAKENPVKPSVDTEHVATTHSPVTTNSTVTTKSKEGDKNTEENVTIHSDHAQRSASEETVEQPVTMSRAETPLDIKKKSINWSDYFGIDRRRKKAGPNGGEKESSPAEHPIDNEWLLNQYYKTFAMNTNPGKKRSAPHMHEHMSSSSISQAKSKKSVVQQPFDTRVFDTDIFARTAQREASKKNSQPANSEQSEESRIDSMDAKLRSIEDQIVNEAVKYTGAHEGTTDSKEIQEVKDKVMARLAAAYSLEKMRLALGEFKSSLMAQKMSRYNPENRQADAGDEKKKRVAVKKEKAEDKKEEDKKKRGDDRNDESEEDEGEFLDGPVVVQPLSEGDMGRRVTDMDTEDDECPVLEEILDTCRSADNLVGDHGQFFLPLCSLHQICYLCGPELGAPSPTACDLMFITEADSMCLGDADCQTAARRSVAVLRRGRGREEEGQCWRSPCIAHHFLHTPLTVPLPAATGR